MEIVVAPMLMCFGQHLDACLDRPYFLGLSYIGNAYIILKISSLATEKCWGVRDQIKHLLNGSSFSKKAN